MEGLNQAQIARSQVKMSQRHFADTLGISIKTLRHWEQGIRVPSGAAEVLLKLLIKYPDLLSKIETLHEPSVES